MPPKKDEQRALLEERRLRTVYDLFESSEYKRALQDCDRVIKKYGGKMGTTVYALKALALTKLCRWEEAHQLLDDLIKEQPTEDATLSPMAIALRDAERHHEVIPLYESACKRSPSEETLNSLFMLYVRERERLKAKTTALQLYKLTDKRTYYFTAVMHQYLCGKESADERQRAMCFTVAEKMLERMVPTVDAEINLHYMILRDSDKIAEAAEFLEKNERHLAMLDVPEERWGLLTRMEDWQRAVELAEASFAQRNCEDHKWLRRRFELGERRSEAIGDVAAKLMSLIENSEGHEKRRETLINKMLILARSKKYDEFETTFLRFYNLFKDRTWCVADALFLLRELPEDQRTSLVSRLSIAATSSGDEECLTWLFIEFEFGPAKSDEEQLKLIDFLCKRFNSSNSKQPLARQSDANPLDGYLELAADIVVERFRCGKDEASLLKLIDELEKAKTLSPNGFRLKMRLLWCYCALQAGLKVAAMCDSLTIKYLQWESLGYLISPYVLRTSFAAAVPLYKRIISLHTNSQKDISEGIVSCYKFGSFHKVEEIEELEPMLENSYELANAKVMRALLAYTADKLQADEKKSSVRPESCLVPTIHFDQLRDNSDMSVLPKRYHFIFTDFEAKKYELKLRYLTLKVLSREVEVTSLAEALHCQEGKSKKINLREDLSNSFAYYIAPMADVEGADFGNDLKERTNSVASIQGNSLRDLSRFAVCAFDWILALACMTVYVAEMKNSTAKRFVIDEIERTEKLRAPTEALSIGDTLAKQVLVEDFTTSWAASLVVLRGAKRLLG